jgi:xanthine dehydrogenase small subunit
VFDALARCPDATLIAGGTDLMVLANQRLQRWSCLISLEAVAELMQLEASADEIVLGAGLPLSDIELHVKSERIADAALLRQLLPLFSSRLIRNRATLGGNLATASPIGDAAPALLALDADLRLVSTDGERRLPLREFFSGYRQTRLSPQEVIVSVHIRRPLPRLQRFYKVSKRVLDDISTVAAAFALDLDDDGRIARLRVAYGGVAATPLALPAVERLALGKPWDPATLQLLADATAREGTPLTDHRGSAAYRRAMMSSLLWKFYSETT